MVRSVFERTTTGRVPDANAEGASEKHDVPYIFFSTSHRAPSSVAAPRQIPSVGGVAAGATAVAKRRRSRRQTGWVLPGNAQPTPALWRLALPRRDSVCPIVAGSVNCPKSSFEKHPEIRSLRLRFRRCCTEIVSRSITTARQRSKTDHGSGLSS